MICVCGAKATIQHLFDNPDCDTAIASLCALRSVSKRVAAGKNGGRPPIMVKCPKCGKEETSTDLRLNHVCKPKRRKKA